MDRNAHWRWDGRQGLALAAGLAVLLGTLGPQRVEAAEPLGPWPRGQMALAGARVAWQIDLPTNFTTSIESYHLVAGYLYGLGSDGFIRAVRADTGEYVWTQKLGEPFDTIWPPVATRVEVVDHGKGSGAGGAEKTGEIVKKTVDAVVFTLLRSAVFLDPQTGHLLEEVALRSSSNAAVAAAPEYYLEVGPNRQLQCVSLIDGLRAWHMINRAPIDIAPVYVARENMVVVADSQGTVTGMTLKKKDKLFKQSLGAKPIGWVAVDDLAVYVATADKMLHAIDRAGDRILWEYRLAAPPVGGPVVTEKYVYQATDGGGLFGIRKGEKRSWHNVRAQRFLAEWLNRTAVLYPDGQIALLHPETGEAAELLDPDSAVEGVSNPWNDAVFLTSPKGRLCCIRPIGAKSLTLTDFRPSSPAVESPEATEKNAGESDTEAIGTNSAVQSNVPRQAEEVLLTDPLRSKRKIVH